MLRAACSLPRIVSFQRQLLAPLIPCRSCQKSTATAQPPAVSKPKPDQSSSGNDGRLWGRILSGDCTIHEYYILLRYASPEKTLRIIQMMLERNIPIKGSVLKTLCRKFMGTQTEAQVFQLFETYCTAVNNDDDNRGLYRLFLLNIGAKRIKAAKELFDRLCASGTADRPTYGHMMRAFASAGDLARVQEVVDKMVASGFEPDGWTMAIVISAFGSASMVTEARSLFDKVRRSYTPEINALIDFSMLDCYRRLHMHREAEQLFREMLQTGPPPTHGSYNTMLKVYTETSNVDGARKLLRTMQERGDEPRLRFFNELIVCFGNAGRVDEAQDLFESLFVSGPPPDFYSYSLIIKVHGEAGNLQQARAILYRMREADVAPNLVVYTTLIRSHCLLRDMKGADEVYKAMIHDGIEPDRRTFSILVDGYQSAHMFHAASDTLVDMLKYGIEPDQETLSHLLRGCIMHDRLSAAEELFEASKARGIVPDELAYAKMIHAYVSQRNFDRAEELTQEMVKNGIGIGTKVYNGLILAHMRNGDGESALHAYKQMAANGIVRDHHTYMVLIDGFVRRDGYRSAIALQLLAEWRATDYVEIAQNGSVFVNLMPFSTGASLSVIWNVLQNVKATGDLELYVGDGNATAKARGRRMKASVLKTLLELGIQFDGRSRGAILLIRASEWKGIKTVTDGLDQGAGRDSKDSGRPSGEG